MAEILLNRGFVSLVDDEDFERLNAHQWTVDTKRPEAPRAFRNVTIYNSAGEKIGKRLRYLHREILNAPKGFTVDHINGNPLDNRKSNLRLVKTNQNIWNSSTTKGKRWKGVTFDKGRGMWKAQLTFNRQPIYLGRYKRLEEALAAYDNGARKYFGEYAAINFPKEGERGAFRGAA